MQTYRSSKSSLLKIGTILLILVLVFGYSSRKAVGLWAGTTARSTDPVLFGLNLNTTVPAIFLTLVALASLLVGCYLLLELLTKITVDENGLTVSAPGLQRVYRWSEIEKEAVSASEVSDEATVRFKLKPAVSASFLERWLYPHRKANYLYLSTALENRPALVALVEERLPTPV